MNFESSLIINWDILNGLNSTTLEHFELDFRLFLVCILVSTTPTQIVNWIETLKSTKANTGTECISELHVCYVVKQFIYTINRLKKHFIP